MSVAVVVPRSPGSCQHRDTAWTWLKARWGALHPTWEIVEGNADPNRWCKAEAVADALTQTGADTLIICDADLAVDPAAATRAVLAVGIGAAWAIPYNSVRRLNRTTTRQVLATDPVGHVDLPAGNDALARKPYSSRPGGGVLVVYRDAYLDAGGFDPRFVGWGGEDIALGFALRTLAGPFTRIRADVHHLWHPPQPDRRPGARGHHADLQSRYRKANENPDAMRALITEREEVHQ